MTSDSKSLKIKPGYGLEKKYLNHLITKFRLKDVTGKFYPVIRDIPKRFKSSAKIRILQFDEKSARAFKARIFSGHNVFHNSLMSNKECCVVLVNKYFREPRLISKEYTFPHEFAHHYQWTTDGFPLLIPKGAPIKTVPPYVNSFRFGPKIGTAVLDGYPLPTIDVHIFLKDIYERISDLICERLLIEKNYKKGFLELYKRERKKPIPLFEELPLIQKMMGDQYAEDYVRYVHRLMLLDAIQIQACVELTNLKTPSLTKMFREDKQKVILLNEGFPTASQVFEKLLSMFLKVDYRMFRDPKVTVQYIKTVYHMLNFQIKTSEKW